MRLKTLETVLSDVGATFALAWPFQMWQLMSFQDHALSVLLLVETLERRRGTPLQRTALPYSKGSLTAQ
jgi:hypothetical protein